MGRKTPRQVPEAYQGDSMTTCRYCSINCRVHGTVVCPLPIKRIFALRAMLTTMTHPLFELTQWRHPQIRLASSLEWVA